MENKIKQSGNRKNELVHMLHETQERFGYIPPERLTEIAKKLNISESEIYGVLTFYKAFTFEPRGKHIVTVCMGTACHVRGALAILEEFKRKLDIDVEQTTPDDQFTLEAVNCVGACALGPIAIIDKNYHGQMNMRTVDKLIKKYSKEDQEEKE